MRWGTAFDIAARQRNIQTAFLLLENGGNMNVLGKQ
jgi:hypothetical protein